MTRRTSVTRHAALPSGAEVPPEVIDWLEGFARLAAKFPKGTGLLLTFDGQGNTHAYIGDEEIAQLLIPMHSTRFAGED